MTHFNCLIEPLVQAMQALFASHSNDSKRLLHGRGKTIAGCEQINVDWFAPVVFVTVYEPVAVDSWSDLLAPVGKQYPGVQAILVQHRYQTECPTELVYGVAPEQLFAKRGALAFELAPFKQQNLGFFLDMEPGRQWLEQRCKGKRVLNLFAYTCAFSVVAAQAGAASVLNVDMSSPALNVGRRNHIGNQLAQTDVSYLKENILKSWGRIRKRGPFDIVIFDPPSFQKGSFVASRDYGKLIRRIPQLCAADGEILACLNAPELDEGFIRDLFASEVPNTCQITRLPPHADFPDVDPERSLKLFTCAYRSAAQ
ncbi:class I SAM-dependent methyltransferase [Halioxenophilus aromaticivorans]|uniref:Class I SAM-dependent methyltransferase n=1 Tax=Halioxenophilus aromaticivorans TaxID=1306992 RepID=A0AAV3U6B4_9ALTE